jgi:PST family polysaccharide transporter
VRSIEPQAESLSERTLGAFAWRFLSETSKLALQVAVQITLARLLPVEAFGLLAIASLVVNLGLRVSEIGTGPALIQRPGITALHIRAAFTVSVFCGLTVTLLIWAVAPLVGTLFKTGGVTPVLRLIAFVFLIGSVGTTAESLMLRAMDYRRLLVVELTSYSLGFAAVGIGLALLGYGVAALAWATVAQTVVKTILLLAVRPHPMRPCVARAEVGQLLNFGIGVTLARLASFVAQNADYFVVARFLGTTALGLYSRAYQLMMLPIYQFSSIVNTVLFPAYSTIQDDSERLRRGYFGALSVSALVVFPALATLGVSAPEIMSGVFGPQWSSAAAPLQVLSMAGAFYCIWNLGDSLVRAKGAVYQKFFCHAVYAALVLGLGYVGTNAGITGVAIGVTTATAVAYLLIGALSLRLLDCGWRPLLAAHVPALAVAAAVVLAGLPVSYGLRGAGVGPIATLAATLAACGLAASAAAVALPVRWLDVSTVPLVALVKRRALETARALLRPQSPPVGSETQV